MLDESRRWRRFEPIEVGNGGEGIQRRIRNAVSVRAVRQEVSALRKTLDLVLDENERLQAECENLRRNVPPDMQPFGSLRAASSSFHTTGGIRSELVRADKSISNLIVELQALRTHLAACALTAETPRPYQEGKEGKRSHGIAPSGRFADAHASSIDALSRVVARWIFQPSTEPRVRLVAAAIRNRLRAKT